ncbi:MAG TPA: c-type cytochrome [Flavitalea sp.]|nr:c-type cytochrome [Flavitalea sp.]
MKGNVALAQITAIFFLLLAIACSDDQPTAEKTDPKTEKLTLLPGFRAERLFSPSENEMGSWVSMTFDDKGRMIASDQYGYLYRLELPAIGTDSIASKVKPERLFFNLDTAGGAPQPKLEMGYAQGLLWAFNSLYVVINRSDYDTVLRRGSGLYRLQDTDNDDQFDKITLLKQMDGYGEHGPHSVVLSPDKNALYVVAGNFTKIPEMNAYRNFPDEQIDNLTPFIKDPNGHDNTVGKHGGWVARVDSTGSHWELISSGFRNAFDLAFNDEGELFTYDSDMEWDFGTPWYRPTRVCHITSGSEFGWRPGTDKWSPVFPDNLPAILNIGQGSPTNVTYGGSARFPEKYRKALFVFDWSFGIAYAVHLEQAGASYKASAEEFISGSPLPLTDGAIGPDGALYFLTGGRRLQSDLYRVHYTRDIGDEPHAAPTVTAELKLRRELEAYHGQPRAGAVDFLWPHLQHPDRFVRYAARIALEHQPVDEWKEKAYQENDPVTLIQAGIALARKAKAKDKPRIIKMLLGVDYDGLSESQKIDITRAFELVFARMGMPDAASRAAVITYFNPRYPAGGGNELNRQLSKLLVYLGDPQAVEKTIAILPLAKDDNSDGQETATNSSDLIMRNPQYGLDIAGMLAKLPPLQQTYYATVLGSAKNGWTSELREKYFKWFYDAFGYKGGHSFVGFIDGARKMALANTPASQRDYYNTISGDSLVAGAVAGPNARAIKPKGPGRRWTVEAAVKLADSGITQRNFKTGKDMFAATLCSSCHHMRGEGGTSGPDLTQLGNRFSYKDMLEAIIEPDKTVSDQYGATVFYLKGGGSVVGRLISEDKDKYVISQNPFAPQVTRDISKKDVVRARTSEVSPMLPGLINRLNAEELKDLLAFLKAGGNEKDTIFSAPKP